MASLVDISEWVNRDSAAEPLIALQPLSQVAPLPLSPSLSPSLVADESRDGKRWNRYSVRPSTAAARQTSDNHYDLAYSLAAAAQKEIGRFAISALQTEHSMLM